MTLPDGLLLTWYGDDFTGSGAVMETLELGGIPAVLFLDVPTPDLLSRFPGRRAIGIAGDARSRSPDWMDAHLPRIFAALRSLGAPVLHHKICSTFDSAPHVGSIGRAAEIGLAQGGWAPMVTAAPQIGRWQVFGNLFARAPDGVARLDRHPTMRHHPSTPMTEADLGRHLAAQTALPVGLVDVLALTGGNGDTALQAALEKGARIVSFDILDTATLRETGRIIWQRAMKSPLFALGSQGLEDALIAHWQGYGISPVTPPRVGGAGRIAVVSGSCSPDTARQIDAAVQAGFAPIRLKAETLADDRAFAAAVEEAAQAARAALACGQSPLIYTAKGPDDPALARVAEAKAKAGLAPDQATARLSGALGGLLAALVRDEGLTRAAIAGGDTSSHATAKLGTVALTVAGTLAPSVPLLHAHLPDPDTAPLELVLKGGQMGRTDLFSTIRDGV